MTSLNETRQRSRDEGVSVILSQESQRFSAFVPWDRNNPNGALVPQRSLVENRNVDNTEVQPQTAFSPAAFFGGSPTSFKLSTKDLSIVDHAFLVFKITNSTGAAVVLPPTAFWFNKIELRAPNSNVLIEIRDIDNWMATCLLQRSDFETISSLISSTDAYSTAGVSIANGASVELYLPLFTLFNACRLHLPGIQGDMELYFETKPSAMILISGTHPTVTSVTLLLAGVDESQEKRLARTRNYRSNTPIYLPFNSWNHFTQSMTLAAGVKTDIRLSGFKGQFSALFFFVRALPLTAANQGTFILMDEHSVRDQSGQIFCGNHVKSAARSKIYMAAQLNNLSTRYSNHVMVPFSSAVVNDFITGQIHGFQTFEGTETLSITPTTGTASGQYQVDVIALQSTALRIQRGEITKRY